MTGRSVTPTLVAVATLALVLCVATRPAPGALPGANGRIAYVDDRQIYSVNANGTGKLELSTGGFNADPAWSPDGAQLAYASLRSGATFDVFVVDRDGTNTRRIVGDPAFHDGDPSWSPDGKQIAYVRSPAAGGRADVWVVNADGSSPRPVRLDAYGPAWSPDGSRIALVTTTARGSSQVFVVDADGGNPRQVTRHNWGLWAPAWSPDGTRIAFISRESGTWEIYVINADGTGERRLTSAPAGSRPGEFLPLYGPAWSPDGAWIAFGYERDGASKLFVMRPDGTGMKSVLQLSGPAGGVDAPTSGSPDWQPAADLGVSTNRKTVRARSGAATTLTAQIKNGSPLAAHQVVVRVDIAGRGTVAGANVAGTACTASRRLVCRLETLAGRQRVGATLRVRARTGIVVVRIRAAAKTPEANSRDNSAVIRIAVQRR